MKKLIFILTLFISTVAFAQDWISTTIDSAGSITSGIFIGGNPALHPIVIEVDTPWTAANITFQVYNWKRKGYTDLEEMDGTEVTATIDSTKRNAVILKPVLNYILTDSIKIRSGTSATPVNQGDTRTIYIKRGRLE